MSWSSKKNRVGEIMAAINSWPNDMTTEEEKEFREEEIRNSITHDIMEGYYWYDGEMEWDCWCDENKDK